MTEALQVPTVLCSCDDEVLRRKTVLPLAAAREVGDKDPTIQAALVADAWRETSLGIIAVGVLMMNDRVAFEGDADRLDAYFTKLVEKRVFTASEARRRLASPKFSKFCAIGKNEALLRREEVIGFLGPSYTTIYQVTVLWQELPETDEQEKLARLVTILESAPDEITREFLSDETERLKTDRKAQEAKRARSAGVMGNGQAGKPVESGDEEREEDIDLALFTPTDRDLAALAAPYAMANELERRLPALLAVREHESVGVIVAARVSALPVIADKLLPLCGFDFRHARTFLIRRPASPEVTDAEVVIAVERGEAVLRAPDAHWFDHDAADPAVIAGSLFPDATKRLHVFAHAQRSGWKCLIGTESWSEE